MKTTRNLTISQLQNAVEMPGYFSLIEVKDHIANPEIRLYADLPYSEYYMSFLYGNDDNQRYTRLVKVSRSDFRDAGLSKDRHALIILNNFPHEFPDRHIRTLDTGLSGRAHKMTLQDRIDAVSNPSSFGLAEVIDPMANPEMRLYRGVDEFSHYISFRDESDMSYSPIIRVTHHDIYVAMNSPNGRHSLKEAYADSLLDEKLVTFSMVEHGKEVVRLAQKVNYWKNKSEELNAELCVLKAKNRKMVRETSVAAVFLFIAVALSIIPMLLG